MRNGGQGAGRSVRRANRRLRWTKGTYRLLKSYRPRVRRDGVVRLLQTRQWRLALTVMVMPPGYVLRVEDYKPSKGAA